MQAMPHLTYLVHFEPTKRGTTKIKVPALPGCEMEVAGRTSAYLRAEKLIERFLKSQAKQGKPFPTESHPNRILCLLVRVKAPKRR